MKILQVCSADALGGGERHVIDLTRALVERGHNLHLAVRPGGPLQDALAGTTVKFHELGLRNALDVISAQQISAIVRNEGIEVIHAHVGRDYIFCGIAARMSKPVRFFLTRHHFNPIKSNHAYSWAIGEARALIAVSDSVREKLADSFPSLVDRIVVIPNWVDSNASDQIDKERARAGFGITRRLAVGIIGKITPLKRQDLFIRAAAHLIKERHWTDADFLIVGEPGESEYVNSLQKMVSELKVENQVRFTGYVEDLPGQLGAFDIIAAPSDDEGFSLALVEAMAAGCAVIATRVGGMAEIVEDGITGLFIERGDMWSLVAALSRLLTDKHLREKVGAIARASVSERFDRRSVIDRIERLYLNSDFELKRERERETR